MLIIIFTIIFIILAVVFYLLNERAGYNSTFEALHFICVIIAASATIIIILFGAMNYYGSYTDYLTLLDEKESLTYKSEAFNNGLADELGLNNNNLLNEIKNYNKSVIELKRNSKSVWIGLFYNPIVKELEVIDYSIFNFAEEENIDSNNEQLLTEEVIEEVSQCKK